MSSMQLQIPGTSASRRLKFEKQLRLIEKSIRTGQPFDQALLEAGWTYDDLRYERSRLKEWTGPPPLRLDQLSQKGTGSQGHRFVSFFTGCGGMDIGLEAAGWKHLAAFEVNEVFCDTLRRNRSNWTLFGPPTHSGDVSQFDEVAALLGEMIDSPFDGLFAGGPPCQPFSIAANQRFAKSGDNFKRIGFAHPDNGNLLAAFIRLVVAFKPRVFLIENVLGLRDVDNGSQLANAIGHLRQNGFDVCKPWILDAADYGISSTQNEAVYSWPPRPRSDTHAKSSPATNWRGKPSLMAKTLRGSIRRPGSTRRLPSCDT